MCHRDCRPGRHARRSCRHGNVTAGRACWCSRQGRGAADGGTDGGGSRTYRRAVKAMVARHCEVLEVFLEGIGRVPTSSRYHTGEILSSWGRVIPVLCPPNMHLISLVTVTSIPTTSPLSFQTFSSSRFVGRAPSLHRLTALRLWLISFLFGHRAASRRRSTPSAQRPARPKGTRQRQTGYELRTEIKQVDRGGLKTRLWSVGDFLRARAEIMWRTSA